MERNHKIFIILVVVGIVASAFIFLAQKAADTALHAQSELNNIIEPMLHDMIASGWERSVFEKHSSPVLKNWFKKNGYAVKESFTAFGKMKEFHGIQNFKMGEEKAQTLSYANFDIGQAAIEIELDKVDDSWLISYINITKKGAK